MSTVAEEVDAVVGVDTHRDTHTLEVASPAGAALAWAKVPNDEAGFAAALAFIAEHVPGPRLVVGLEGTRSYGIGLAQALMFAGFRVVEVERPARTERRGRGKSDPIDAHLACLHVLRLDVDKLPVPRADGDREALRILLTARQEMTITKTAQTNRLHALLLAGDDTDRRLARGAFTDTTLAALTRRRGRPEDTRSCAIRRAESRRLAIAIREADRALKANKAQLAQIVTDLAPQLLDRPGIGPVSAAQAIVSFSHHGRLRSDAAFASLAGVCPIPASSGRHTRMRLNRGGDRALNRAVHTIAVTRWRCCPRTADYIARRRSDGKTDREIRRLLKRYIVRELYRTLNGSPALDNT